MIVNCTWSSWDAWTKCSKTCDEGSQTSRRNIVQHGMNGGTQCIENSTKVQPCNLPPCPGISNAIDDSSWVNEKKMLKLQIKSSSTN